MQYVNTGRHFFDITLVRYCVKLGAFYFERCCFCVPVTASFTTLLWNTAANGKHGSVTSSHTVTVLLHLFPDIVPHHSGIFLQLLQLHALLLHPLLITLELLLQFCNHTDNYNERKISVLPYYYKTNFDFTISNLYYLEMYMTDAY